MSTSPEQTGLIGATAGPSLPRPLPAAIARARASRALPAPGPAPAPALVPSPAPAPALAPATVPALALTPPAELAQAPLPAPPDLEVVRAMLPPGWTAYAADGGIYYRSHNGTTACNRPTPETGAQMWQTPSLGTESEANGQRPAPDELV